MHSGTVLRINTLEDMCNGQLIYTERKHRLGHVHQETKALILNSRISGLAGVESLNNLHGHSVGYLVCEAHQTIDKGTTSLSAQY